MAVWYTPAFTNFIFDPKYALFKQLTLLILKLKRSYILNAVYLR